MAVAGKKRVTNEDLEDLASWANELSMEMILMHNKIQRGEADEIVNPAHVLRIMNNLAMWSSQFSIVLLDKLEQQIRDERNARTKDDNERMT